MSDLIRSRNVFRAVVAIAVAVVLAIGLPLRAEAAWNAADPIGGKPQTGRLGIDDATLAGGSWTDSNGKAFAPASDKLAAGGVLTYTVTGVAITAIGDNLSATLKYAGGAAWPDGVADHVGLTIHTDPVTILGSGSDADGQQRIKIILTLTADGELPTGVTLDLSRLTVELTNGHAWTDTATINAGMITTARTAAAGGSVILIFDRSYDSDNVVGFYLKNPDPGTMISWNLWRAGSGQEVVTEAKDGLNSMDYSGTASTPYVRIKGSFDGFGSAAQTENLIGALTNVQGWTDAIGSTSARYAFLNATHLREVNALPNSIRDASYAFKNAGSKASSMIIQNWTAANVTSMAHMLEGATTFNQWGLSTGWNTAKVTDMSYLFAGATSFSYPIDGWDTSRVRTMEGMFAGATSYTGTWSGGPSIRSWNVSAVQNMASMFEGAAVFNADIGSWQVRSVTTMAAMFKGAKKFDQDLSKWDVGAVTTHAAFSAGSALSAGHQPIWKPEAPVVANAGPKRQNPPADKQSPAVDEPAAEPTDSVTSQPDLESDPPSEESTPQPSPKADPTGPADEPQTCAEAEKALVDAEKTLADAGAEGRRGADDQDAVERAEKMIKKLCPAPTASADPADPTPEATPEPTPSTSASASSSPRAVPKAADR